MSAVRIVRLLAQFVAVPILARLLSPEEYGLVALAMPFALFAMMLADAGVGMSLVRTPLTNRAEWSSSFWLTLMLGAALAGLMMLLAPLAAMMFAEPHLAPMLITLAFVVLAQAAHVIPISALQQAGRFNTIALVDVSATAAGITTALVMAYGGYGAWSLIGQQVAYFAVRVVLACLLSPFRPSLHFSWAEVRPHAIFGRDVLGNSLSNYYARAFDQWVVGRVLGTAIAGFYSMAFLFARLPVLVLSGPLQYVMYAHLARIKHNPTAIAHYYLMMTRIVAAIILPGMGLVAVAHAPVFTLLLSDKWADAGVLFSLAALGSALQAINGMGETVLFALGHTARQLRASLAFAALWSIILLLTVRESAAHVAAGFSLAVILYQCFYVPMVLRALKLRMVDYLKVLVTPAILTSGAMALYYFVVAPLGLALWPSAVMAAMLAIIAIGFSLGAQRGALRKAFKQM